ncbi:DUF6583 family protein [Halobacillus massiliensis]|uniref:DUF6583 family protein n=1 Tax=Halobacillus massiliensis TaxID=1926286 RepID=UPI0009E39B46|nr:DUF6583 family protein [Halobacillus massiliensis]
MSAEQTKKGLNKKLIMALTVLVILVISVTAYAVLRTGDPMTMYMKAQKNTMDEQFERMDQYAGDYLALSDRLAKEANESTGTLTMDMRVSGDSMQMVPELAMAQGILSSSELEVNRKLNPETKEMAAALDLKVQGTSVGNVELYQNEDQAALHAPFVYDKYFAMANDDYGEFLEQSGQPVNGVTELPNIAELMQSQLTYEESKELLEDYMVTLGKELNEDQFSLTENAEFDGENYDKVTIEISEEEAQQMLVTLLEKMKEDEAILGLLETQTLMQQDNESAMIKIEDEIDKTINDVENLKLPEGITIEAYLKDDLVAHQIWTMNLQPEGEEKVMIEITSSYLKEDEDTYKNTVDVNIQPESKKDSFTINYVEEGKPNDNGLHVNYTIGFAGDMEGDSFNGELVLNTDYVDNGSETAFTLNIEEPNENNEEGMMLFPDVSGFLNTTMTEEEDNKVNQVTEIGIESSAENPEVGTAGMNFEFNYDQDITFTDDLSFPSLSEDETIQAMEMTDEEWEKISMEIQANFEKHMMSIMGNFGGMGGF